MHSSITGDLFQDISSDSSNKKGLASDPACTRCPKLCMEAVTVCMSGKGAKQASLMIVSDQPALSDDTEGKVFSDVKGSYFREHILLKAQVPTSKVWFTHAVRCYARGKVSSAEIKHCREYLTYEIGQVQPRVIIGLGIVVIKSILSLLYKSTFTEADLVYWRGKQIWVSEFNCWFIPTFSLADIHVDWRGRNYYNSCFIADCAKAWKLAQAPVVVPDKVMTVSIDSSVEAISVLKKMQANGRFAFDIETGIDPDDKWVPKIIGFSISCDASIGYYIAWSLVQDVRDVRLLLYQILSDSSIMKIMHNGAYEVRVLRGNDVPLSNKYFDTMIAAGLIDENFSKRLKDLAWVYTSFGGYDTPLMEYINTHKIGADYSQIPFSMLSQYGALDAVATWCLYVKQAQELQAEGVKRLFWHVVMPFRYVLDDVEETGIYFDNTRAQELRGKCEGVLERLQVAVYEQAGGEFNIDSSQQLGKVLYKDLKFLPLKKTKTGHSVDRESILHIAKQENSQIAEFLLDMSYVRTLLKTHILQGMSHRQPDGRVHGYYNVTGTVTGRVSAYKPSLQNVPQDRLIRSLYSASPGNWLIEADFKSAELAVIAAVSGEKSFIEAFERGIDPHAQTYRTVNGLPDDYEPTKAERKIAKGVNFGLVYGISIEGLANFLDMPMGEVSDFVHLYFKKLPNIHAWMENQKKLARDQGYVVSIFNRKRRLPLAMSDMFGFVNRAERQAMNAPIQSGAADYTYMALIRLSQLLKERGLGSKIVHTVHDCGLVDTMMEEKDTVIEAFYEAFETQVPGMAVKMKIDIEVNKSWGETNSSKLEEIFQKFGIVA